MYFIVIGVLKVNPDLSVGTLLMDMLSHVRVFMVLDVLIFANGF